VSEDTEFPYWAFERTSQSIVKVVSVEGKIATLEDGTKAWLEALSQPDWIKDAVQEMEDWADEMNTRRSAVGLPVRRKKLLGRGVQVVYVPRHANGNIDHPDCEQGFITSVRGSTAFCRFWSKTHEGLRTESCSESVHISDLVACDTRPQEVVTQWLIRYDSLWDRPEAYGERGRSKLFKS